MDDEIRPAEYVIRSVLYGTLSLPERDIPETVAVLADTLAGAGWSIVRTDDHVSKTALVKLAEKLDRDAEYEGDDYSVGLGVAANRVRKIID